MTVLIQLRDAYKRFGEQQLLDRASISLVDNHNVGMIGRNGAGKSTMLRILLEEEELDSGEVVRHRRLRLGYLQQHNPFEPGEAVLEFLMRDSGQPEWRCAQVAWQFEIQDAALRGPVDQLSGGWQTRVKLAALLLHDPNLLLLDEPTNFLDLRTQLLLQHFLRSFAGACLVVSHDRAFLKATCDHTLSLARGELTMFPGDVDAFLVNQQERREHDRRVNATVATKRRQLETFINKNRANANTASQARSKAKQLERLKLTEIEMAESDVRVRVPEVERRRGDALACEQLAIGYPDRLVADQISLRIEHGSRVAVVGDNGQGKTTFLRTVTDSLSPLDGSFRWAIGCDIGTYAQHVYTSLPENWTVREYLESAAASGVGAQTVVDTAGSFLFRGELIDKSIRVLSGGERARLCLAGLLLGGHNVLVLDEPINHLDVETVDALAEALCRYQGTIVFTSHDRHFMRRVATDVIEIRDRGVSHIPDSYDTYVYRLEKEIDVTTATPATPKRLIASQPPVAMSAASPKASGREQHATRKAIAALERKIKTLDDQKRQIDQRLRQTTDPIEAQRLHDNSQSLSDEVAQLEEQWFELQEDFDS